jgi:hypothetical protein
MYSTAQCTVQQNAQYSTMHSTAKCTVQQNAQYSTMHSTAKFTVQHNAQYSKMHSTAQCTNITKDTIQWNTALKVYRVLVVLSEDVILQFDNVTHTVQSPHCKLQQHTSHVQTNAEMLARLLDPQC